MKNVEIRMNPNRAADHEFSNVRLMLLIVLLLINAVTIGLAHANFTLVQYSDGEQLQLSVTDNAEAVSGPERKPDWLIEYRGKPTPEVVGRVSEDGICIRIAYGLAGAMFTNVGGSPLLFQGGVAGANPSCKDEILNQPVFQLQVKIPKKTRNYLGLNSAATISVRISMNIPGEVGEQVSLHEFQWKLEARNAKGEWLLVGGLNLSEPFSDSRWNLREGSGVRYTLTLHGELGDESALRTPSRTAASGSTSDKGPLTIQYGVKDGLEAPQEALLVNGRVLDAWDKMPLAKQISISWDESKGTPEKLQLCIDSDCTELVQNLSTANKPVILSRAQISAPEKVYLIVEWRSPSASNSASSITQPAAADVAFALAPVLSFGNYERPLTSCLARFSGGVSSESFRLRLGYQELTKDKMPQGTSPETTVDIIFDASRAGGDCPVQNLQIPAIPIAELQSLNSGKPKKLSVSTDAGLFVGYLQLNGADYRESLARWRETIGFYNVTYQLGRQNQDWLDGLVYGAGERGGLNARIEPSSNFSSTLGDESTLIEAAKAMHSDTRVSSNFFADQLAEIREKVGDARVTLVYFDDFPGGCGDYATDIAQSGLRVERALVVTALADYTGASDSIKSIGNGLAHLCEKSDVLSAYAFNWRERMLNLDWDSTLASILDDWYK